MYLGKVEGALAKTPIFEVKSLLHQTMHGLPHMIFVDDIVRTVWGMPYGAPLTTTEMAIGERIMATGTDFDTQLL